MKRGRSPKYDWDDLLCGERRVLNSVEHFPGVGVRSMRQQVINEARRRGVAVTTRIAVNPRGDGIDYLDIRRPAVAVGKRLDWDKLLKRLPTRFEFGRDFTCEPESMRVRIYQAAQRRDIKVTTELDEHNTIVVRAKKEEA